MYLMWKWILRMFLCFTGQVIVGMEELGKNLTKMEKLVNLLIHLLVKSLNFLATKSMVANWKNVINFISASVKSSWNIKIVSMGTSADTLTPRNWGLSAKKRRQDWKALHEWRKTHLCKCREEIYATTNTIKCSFFRPYYTCTPRFQQASTPYSTAFSWATQPYSGNFFRHTKQTEADDGIIPEPEPKDGQHLQYANVTKAKVKWNLIRIIILKIFM